MWLRDWETTSCAPRFRTLGKNSHDGEQEMVPVDQVQDEIQGSRVARKGRSG